jgi:N-glycosylase/DNA lyase
MKELVTKVKELQESRIERLIDKRLKQFKSLNRKSNKDWFSELCFCLLTANTSARLGIKIQKELGYKGFTENKNEEELALRLKKAKYRFYNRRAHFIFLANKYKNIKDILKKQKDKREWLVEHIKGLGYKEASHFLRNVGLFDYAIIDKHILNVLREADLIKAKTMNKKNYLRAEDILKKIAKELRMSLGELDLYLWYMKTGEVLK